MCSIVCQSFPLMDNQKFCVVMQNCPGMENDKMYLVIVLNTY